MPVPVPVTLLYGGLNALLITALGMQVSRLGSAHGVGVAARTFKPSFGSGNRRYGNWLPWSRMI